MTFRGMVDRVFGEIELPSLEADWKAIMRGGGGSWNG